MHFSKLQEYAGLFFNNKINVYKHPYSTKRKTLHKPSFTTASYNEKFYDIYLDYPVSP